MKKLVFLLIFFLLVLIYLPFVKSVHLEKRQETEVRYGMLTPTLQKGAGESTFLYKTFGTDRRLYSTVKIGNQTYTYDEKLATDLQEAGIEFNFQDLVDYSNANEIPIMVKYQSPVAFSPKVGISTEGKTTVKDVSSFSDNINTISSIKSVTNTNEGKFKHSFKTIPYASLKIPRNKIKDFKSNLYSSLGNKLEKISIVSKFHTLLMDSVPLINADDVWQLQDSQGRNITGENVTIAIIDTGIDYTHPDFGNCTPPANPCTGNVNLTLSPNPVNTSSNVHANVKGVYNCSFDLTSVVRKDSCNGEIACMYGGCGKVSDGQIICDCYFTSPDTPGNYTYYGCVDKNKDGYYNDPGEFDLEILNVTSIITLLTKTQVSILSDTSTNCKIIGGYNFVDENDDPSDDNGHGTHCAGIAAGNGTLKGVAPDAKLIAYKVLDSTGSGWLDDIIAAIERAQDPNQDGNYSDHVDIISMSLGGYTEDPDSPFSQAVDTAVENGVVVVVAAGNCGPQGSWSCPKLGDYTIATPGTARKVITVGASDKNDNIAGFSSRGPTVDYRIKPDVVAPGVSICSSQWDNAWNSSKCYDNSHVAISGTSMATPHVAGVVALIKQAHPDWTPDEIKYALRNTAIDLGYDINTQGYGRIDVLKAVQLTNAPPVAWLNTSSVVEGIINITGVIKNGNFKNYTLYYGEGWGPTSWTEIFNSTSSVINGVLYSNFDSSLLSDGNYILRLTVASTNEQVSEDRTIIIVDNIKALITYPLMSINNQNPVFGNETITIEGSAFGPNFQNYTVKYAPITNLNNWALIYNSTIPVTNGTLAILNTDKIDSGEYMIKLTLNTLNYKDEDNVNVTIDKTIKNGWPQKTNDGIISSPAIVDIDNDGDMEIIIGSIDKKLYIWHHDGSLVDGWPQKTEGSISSSPAAGDLDRDGNIEVVVGSEDGKVYVWYKNGTLVDEWPQKTDGIIDRSSPTLADIDNDGDLEIIIGSSDKKLYIWHHNGSLVDGWPKDVGDIVLSTPAVADIDNDGDLEILIGTNGRKFFAWHHNGTLVDGWPQDVTYSIWTSSPAIADIDNDGDLEIFVGTQGAQVFGWHHNGTLVNGWPQDVCWITNSNPAIGDIDNDGDLEIITADTSPGSDFCIPPWNGNVFAWHDNGTLVNGWPKSTGITITSHPSLGDIDGDGDIEIIVGCEDGKIYAWHDNGTPVDGWPKKTGSWVAYQAAALGDIDQDRKIEVIVGSEDYKVYVWNLNAVYDSSKMEWPTFHHDTQHTGQYTKPSLSPPQWSNLRNIPDPVIGQIPVDIHVTWYDDKNLDTVIISENSTGAWVNHICNLITGQCSGEIRLVKISLSVVIVVIACLLILTFMSKTGVIKISNTLLVFLGLILCTILLSIFMFPEISRNLSRTLMRMGIIPMIEQSQTFTHTIPASQLEVGEVVGYKSYANDTAGNEAETITKSFVVQPITTTTIEPTTTSIPITTTTIPNEPDVMGYFDMIFLYKFYANKTNNVSISISNHGNKIATNVTATLYDLYDYMSFYMFEGEKTTTYLDGVFYNITINKVGTENNAEIIISHENETKTFNLYRDGIGKVSNDIFVIPDLISIYDKSVYLHFGKGIQVEKKQLADISPLRDINENISWTPSTIYRHILQLTVNCTDDLNPENNGDSEYVKIIVDAPDVTGNLYIYNQLVLVNQIVDVNVMVRNEGGKNATNVTAELYDYLPNSTRVNIWNKTIDNLSPVDEWPNYVWEVMEWTPDMTGSHRLELEVNCDNDWDSSNNFYNLTVSVYEPMNVTFYITDHLGSFTNVSLWIYPFLQIPYVNISQNVTLPKTEKVDVWFVRPVGKDVEALMLWNSTMNETMKSIFENYPGKIYSDDLILHSIIAYNASWNYDNVTMAFPIIDYDLHDSNKTSVYACSVWDWDNKKCISGWHETNATHEWQGEYYKEYLFSNTTQTNAFALAEPQYCGDGYCSLSESCSSCSADCGNCQPSSQGGGGGGGGGVAKEKKNSQTWMKITPGKAEIMHIDDPDIGLKMINISVKNPATFVTITVTKLTGKPASVIHNITGKVYKYIDITSTNLPDNNIDKAKIQFQVNKSWIVSNKIDRTKITLNRYKNNNWERLPTLEISEDNDYVYYEAETSGFSTFAITGEEKVITTTITATTSLPTKITTTTISEKKITGVRSYVIIVFATTILVSVAMIVFIKKYVGIERRKKTPEAFSATPSLIFKFPNQYVGKRVALSGNIEFIKKVEKTGNFWHFIKDENSKIYVLSDKMIQPGPIKIIGIIEESKGHIFIRAGKVEID